MGLTIFVDASGKLAQCGCHGIRMLLSPRKPQIGDDFWPQLGA